MLLALAAPRAFATTDATTPPAPELGEPASGLAEADVDALPRADSRRPALLLALAVARHLEAAAAESQERAAHENATARWLAAPVRAPGAPPILATPRADGLRGDAARLCQRILEEAPRSPELPQALLLGGIDAERIGRSAEAMRMLGMLIRRFPASAFVPDAWLALGEHYLRGGDLSRARVAFDQAERRGRAPIRAWAAARLAEVALAVSDPGGVVAAISHAIEAGSPRALALLDRLGEDPRRLRWPADALLALADLLDGTAAVSASLSMRQVVLSLEKHGAVAVNARSDLERRRHEAARVAAASGSLRTTSDPGELDGAARETLRLAAASGDVEARHTLALAALRAGRAGEACLLLEEVRAARSGEAGSAEVENDLAAALFALGDVAGAGAALRRALERDPSLAVARSNLELIGRERGAGAEGGPASAR